MGENRFLKNLLVIRQQCGIIELMKQIATKIATDDHGSPVMVPATAVEFQVMRIREGKPGRPSFLCRGRKRVKYPIDVDPDTIMELPSGTLRFDPLDANGQRVGESIFVTLEHIDDEPDAPEDGGTNDAPARMESQWQMVFDEMKEMNRELRKTVDTVVKTLRESYADTVKANVEITRHLPGVIDASARMLQATQGGGLAKAADEIREIWEAAPEGSNNLETVLSSPVVAGAAAALQKYMAQAAQNSAETMAEDNGKRRESGAQRAARIAMQANMRAERERSNT